MRCSCREKDPLLNVVWTRYHAVALAAPRTGSAVGDLYVMKQSGWLPPCRIEGVVTPSLVLPPPLVEDVVPLEASSIIDARVASRVVADALPQFGIPDVAKVRAAYANSAISGLSLGFTNVQRTSIYIDQVDRALVGRRLAERSGAIEGYTALALVIGTLSARALHVTAHDRSGNVLDVSGELSLGAEASSQIQRASEASEAIVYTGPQAVVFAVELLAIDYWSNDGSWHFDKAGHSGGLRSGSSDGAIFEQNFFFETIAP